MTKPCFMADVNPQILLISVKSLCRSGFNIIVVFDKNIVQFLLMPLDGNERLIQWSLQQRCQPLIFSPDICAKSESQTFRI